MAQSPNIQPIEWKPVGGINSEENEASIDDSECQDGMNFIFEKGQATTRPGIGTSTVTGMGGLSVQYAYSLWAGYQTQGGLGTAYTVAQTTDANARIFILTGNPVTATEITGANVLLNKFAVAFIPAAVNNSIIIPGVTDVAGGLLRWVPGAAAATVVHSASSYQFVVGHLSRAVGANAYFRNFGNITIDWSKAGDETVWNTSPSTDGSGRVILSDVSDNITGLFNIHNVLVVCRTNGFHLGYATGTAIPAFRFEPFNRNGIGVYMSSSACDYNNIIYFVGKDNVYSFDLVNIKPIGNKIQSRLTFALRAGIQYVGSVVNLTVEGSPRARYHLVPTGAQANAGSPHFVYDIKDGTWSMHSYSASYAWSWNWIPNVTTTEGLAFINGTPPVVSSWNNFVALDTAAFMTSKTVRIPPYTSDHRIVRAMMSGRDFADPGAIGLTITGQLGTQVLAQTDSHAIGVNNNGKWTRTRYNFDKPMGQDITARVDVPAGSKFTTDSITIETAEQGDFRG